MDEIGSRILKAIDFKCIFGFILNESLSLTKVISSFFHLAVLHLEVLVFKVKHEKALNCMW